MSNNWIDVNSSVIARVRYHRKESWLDAELLSGKVYRYANVSFEEYGDVLTGGDKGSVGKAFNDMKCRHEGEVTELKPENIDA